MTAQPPSGLTVAGVIARLSLRQARRGRLLRVTALVLCLPLLASVAGLLSGNAGASFFDTLVDLYLRYLIALVLALHASTSVAEEVQGKTITYLWSRPIPRWALPLGKYLSTVAVNAGLLLVSLCACYAVMLLGDPYALLDAIGKLARTGVAILLATAYFGALAAAFGAMVSSFPSALMMIYVLALEVGFSFVPGWIKTVSMTVHLRAIAGTYVPEHSLLVNDPQLTPAVSLPVVVVVTTVWLVIALSIAAGSEYRVADRE